MYNNPQQTPKQQVAANIDVQNKTSETPGDKELNEPDAAN